MKKGLTDELNLIIENSTNEIIKELKKDEDNFRGPVYHVISHEFMKVLREKIIENRK